MTVDVIVGAFLVGGNDAFNTGCKVGAGIGQTADLGDADRWEYMRPFAGTLARYPGTRGVVLHDGLGDEFVAAHTSPQLTFERAEVPARHAAHERRFFAFRDWLAANPDAGLVWLVDVNDVVFTAEPFAWLAANATPLACGEEWNPYGDSRWFRDAWDRLPREYGEAVRPHRARPALNCGAVGGTRAALLPAVAAMCGHLDRMRAHVDRHHPGSPTMLDMHAWAHVALQLPVATFKMDGRSATDAGVPSPLVHDRGPALALARRAGVFGPDELPDDLAVRVDHTQRLPGWCQPAKAQALAALVLRERPALCVELGVYGGRSAMPVALALRHLGAGVLYAVDPYTFAAAREGDQFGPDPARYWTDGELTRVRAEFVTAAAAAGVLPHLRLLDAPAERVAGAFDPGTVDLLHVDGNHSTPAVARDLALYLPLVRPGGWVAVDDTDWPSVQAALGPLEAAARLVRDAGPWRLYRVR